MVHYLLIGEMTCLGHWDEFPKMSALVCMVIHWIRLTMNHDINYWVVMIHQATMLHRFSTLREY